MKWAILLILLCCLLPRMLSAQTSLSQPRMKSWQEFVYKITAKEAEKYILSDSIDIDRFVSIAPTAIFQFDSVEENKLPLGQYVLISIVDNRISASLLGVTNLILYPINNQQHIQLLLKDRNEHFIDDAQIWVKGKKAKYHVDAQSYWAMQNVSEKVLVKAYTPHDTLFMFLSPKDELDISVAKQRWDNLKRTWLLRKISRLPKTIKHWLSPSQRYPSSSAGTTGLMVFNQPKYKQTDTVKLKAYVFSKNWKVYNKPVEAFLEYSDAGKSYDHFLKMLYPSSPGSYVFQFPLSDSLKSDLSYTVMFKNKEKKKVLSKSFRMEDYLLDEISTYQARSDKDSYYYGDTMHIYASANNSNGQSLLDGRAKLILITSRINKFYKDSLYIPDSLYVQEKALQTNGETEFEVDTKQLPDAQLKVKAILEFKNSNNEIQDKELEISYKPHEIEFNSFVEKDSIIAVYKENGRITPAEGLLCYLDQSTQTQIIHYPYKVKLNGLTDDYVFYLLKNQRIVDSCKTNIEGDYDVTLQRISHGDTLGFILNNPNKIPVSFTVFDGNKIKGTGKGSGEQISWTTQTANKQHVYTVNWQYYWKGEEKSKEQSIALLYKLLNIDIQASATVFPGQHDSIEINVRDYHQKPVAGVNLTVMSYNNQFSKDIHVQEPPYLVRYKTRPTIKRDKYEDEDCYISKGYPLGLHSAWINKFGLDSMLYYQMLFPQKEMLDATTPISDFIPQLSVHLVDNGERKQIYLLYVNRRLVYYNAVTDPMKDAYQAYMGFSQIGIRLLDKFVEIDSIYLQPFYKHDLFFDLQKLPKLAKITPMPDTLSDKERFLLENSLWNLDNNAQTNTGYVWQQEKIVKLSGNYQHIVGPFNSRDSLHYFAPNYFDIHFRFEPGYQYDLSKNILRLERQDIFPDKKRKPVFPKINSPLWVLGDTIPTRPIIDYKEPFSEKARYLKTWGFDKFGWNTNGNGKIYFMPEAGIVLKYAIVFPDGHPEEKIISSAGFIKFSNLTSGHYHLILVDSSWHCAEIKQIPVLEYKTYCINLKKALFVNESELVAQWERETLNPLPKIGPPPSKPDSTTEQNLPLYQTGKSGISGKIIDKNGKNGIPGATILVKGTRTGTSSLANGNFAIGNLKPGKCTLVIVSIGYVRKEVQVNIPDFGQEYLEIPLSISNQSLQEVVVVGYGLTNKRDLTGSLIFMHEDVLKKMPNLQTLLEGKVAGISILERDETENLATITLRGLSSLDVSQKPLFVVDGILYEDLPRNISPDMIASASILKGEDAIGLYGARAAHGAIVLTTHSKNIRNKFRDYAYWEPELFTDKNGKVRFEVEYPDNVTGWQTYVLGMDKHKRIGKSFSFVQSFKPLVAQISMPQFLLEGDSAEIIGKSLNYSSDEYKLKTNFLLNGVSQPTHASVLSSKGSTIEKYSMVAKPLDSVQAAFHIQTSTGFQDQEEKQIPIFPIGSLETTGKFWILEGDTTIGFKPPFAKGDIKIFAENNTLEVLLDEIEYLKKYPYFCMEQTASKLSGLLMQKRIRQQLHEKFDGDKSIQLLITKLQKNQLFEGGWSWWENGRPNLFITQYVLHALLPIRSEGMIETNIRNGLLYLQGQLPSMRREALLSTLSLMSEAKHLLNYQTWLDLIPYDSLTMHQQWQFLKIMQEQKMDYTDKLAQIIEKGTKGILGSLHWGIDTYHWYNDEEITTLLAFEVLKKVPNQKKALAGIVQYFLEQRANSHWRNTVASASIVSSLLPYLLEETKNFNSPASIRILGDTNFEINKFPYKLTMKYTGLKEIQISKSGGGLAYLTLFQEDWNKNPKSDSSQFRIHAYFEKNGQKLTHLVSGEKIKMIVEVDALKDADYTMLEIPIPAGCTYASKPQDIWYAHKEYLKNKVVIFSEEMSKGAHRFEVELETRYNGLYQINPAKVSLMYFPTFSGNNEVTSVCISADGQNK